MSDKKFGISEEIKFSWKEKLATLSLILLASTSPTSAIRLDNRINKEALNDVFQRVIEFMNKFKITKEEIRGFGKIKRGESPASALMSRLNDLPRKTRHYYKYEKNELAYYLDIENNGQIEERKLFFLLRKIFDLLSPKFDFNEICTELAEISNSYCPKFIKRAVNPKVHLSILGKIKDFLDIEMIRRLSQPNS